MTESSVLAMILAGALLGATGDSQSLRQQVEDCLTSRFKETDIPRTDYAVLLATRYRHALQEAHAGEPDPAVLRDILERCRDPRPGRILPLESVKWEEAPPLIDAGDPGTLKRALKSALAQLGNASKSVSLGGARLRNTDLARAIRKLNELVESGLSGERLAAALPQWFDLYRSPGAFGTGEVLFTSYASPVYEGSLKKDETYRFPLYRNPAHAGLSAKEFDRKAIYGGALAGHGLETAYLAERMDEFQIQIEGSGFIHLPDGSYLHLTYASQNGRSYKSLGKAMLHDGLFKPWEIDNPAVRRYFHVYPEAERPYLERNPSYVFFDVQRMENLPVRPELSPERSVALDRKYYPRGLLLFAHTQVPRYADGLMVGRAPFERFVLALDVGGAIRGPGRVDLYQGAGPGAQVLADTMKEPGALFVLLPKGTELVTE